MSMIRKHLQGTTIIVVNHQTATLGKCRDMVVLEDGRIIKTGVLASRWAQEISGDD